jgi:endogenous inhibitor of DNA gyrase (YacG/DUF329 family)
MAQYVEHRCPSCDRTVGRTRRTKATVGRPYEECPDCGTYVPRRPYDEWALMSSRTRARVLFGNAALCLAAGLVPVLVAGVVVTVTPEYDPLRTIALVAGCALLLALAFWAIGMGRVLARSQRRMSDPWYRAKLVQFAIQEERRGAQAAGLRPTTGKSDAPRAPREEGGA